MSGILTFEEDDETNLTSTIAGPKSQTQVTDWKAVTKDGLGVASRFLLTLLKRLPEQGGVGIKKRHLGSNFFFQW